MDKKLTAKLSASYRTATWSRKRQLPAKPKALAVGKNSKSSKKTDSWFKRLGKWILRALLKLALWTTLFATLVGLGFGYYLDRTITKTF